MADSQRSGARQAWCWTALSDTVWIRSSNTQIRTRSKPRWKPSAAAYALEISAERGPAYTPLAYPPCLDPAGVIRRWVTPPSRRVDHASLPLGRTRLPAAGATTVVARAAGRRDPEATRWAERCCARARWGGGTPLVTAGAPRPATSVRVLFSISRGWVRLGSQLPGIQGRGVHSARATLFGSWAAAGSVLAHTRAACRYFAVAFDPPRPVVRPTPPLHGFP